MTVPVSQYAGEDQPRRPVVSSRERSRWLLSAPSLVMPVDRVLAPPDSIWQAMKIAPTRMKLR